MRAGVGACVLVILAGLGAGRASIPAHADGHEKRIALLIQNDLYPDAEPSKTVDDDASTLAALLKRDGFDVELRKNVDKQDMRSSLDAFVSRITPPGVGHANCTDCGNKSGRPEIEPVRSYPANGFGLFDMAGNVALWLQDCRSLTYRGAPTDGTAAPVASCKMRGMRGGSFETSSAYVKPTARFRDAAEARSQSTGFRVARDVE